MTTSTIIDAEPDQDVAALQAVQAILISAEREIRPVLLRAEQRQRMRERSREARAKTESAPPLERKRA